MLVRYVSSLVAGLCWAGLVQAQSIPLQEGPLEGNCFRIEMTLDLQGKITVRQEDKTLQFPQQAQARHEFVERVLKTKENLVVKSARKYARAEATIVFDKEKNTRTLRAERRFLVAQQVDGNPVVYSPHGPLRQEEMELTEHFDTLHLAGLLPDKAAAVGDTWKLAPAVVQGLCGFDGLIEHDLTGKLTAVEGTTARLSVTGKAKGIDLGAEVVLLVHAEADFDTANKRLVGLRWKQSDQRQQGPVNPSLSADVTITLKRTPVEVPKELNDFALVPIPGGETPPEPLTDIRHVDAAKRFVFAHGRRWHLVGVKDEQVVLRLLDRGDFVAQATLTPWKAGTPGKHMTPDEFAALMAAAPTWEQETLIEKTDKVDLPHGHHGLRVAASGNLDGVKAVQFFYLVTAPQGERMIVTFTMTPTQVSRLEGRDVRLVRSLVFPSSGTEWVKATNDN